MAHSAVASNIFINLQLPSYHILIYCIHSTPHIKVLELQSGIDRPSETMSQTVKSCKTPKLLALIACALLAAGQYQYLSALPAAFIDAPASWALISYSNPSVAVIDGAFNRTISEAPWASQTSNAALQQA